jgi:hypothetical protein
MKLVKIKERQQVIYNEINANFWANCIIKQVEKNYIIVDLTKSITICKSLTTIASTFCLQINTTDFKLYNNTTLVNKVGSVGEYNIKCENIYEENGILCGTLDQVYQLHSNPKRETKKQKNNHSLYPIISGDDKSSYNMIYDDKSSKTMCLSDYISIGQKNHEINPNSGIKSSPTSLVCLINSIIKLSNRIDTSFEEQKMNLPDVQEIPKTHLQENLGSFNVGVSLLQLMKQKGINTENLALLLSALPDKPQ